MFRTKERTLTLTDVVKSPQFAYVTYDLDRDVNGIYSIDVNKPPQLGFAANPMVYFDNNGIKHEIIHSAYMPELADHKFAVTAVGMTNVYGQFRYFMLDLSRFRSYTLILAPHIKLRYLSEHYNG